MFSRISGVNGFKIYSCDMAQIERANGRGQKKKLQSCHAEDAPWAQEFLTATEKEGHPSRSARDGLIGEFDMHFHQTTVRAAFKIELNPRHAFAGQDMERTAANDGGGGQRTRGTG